MNRTIWIGVIGGALLVLALLLNWVSNPEPVAENPGAVPEASEPADAPAGETASGQESETETADGQAPPAEYAAQSAALPTTEDDSSVDTPEAVPVEAPPEAGGPIEPSFDVVRIDSNGDTVIAGRSEPGSTVTILDNGAGLGSVTADDRGEWVYLPSSPLDPGPHELTLQADLGESGTLTGGGTVVLVVPKPGQDIAGRETDKPEQQPLVILVPDSGTPGTQLLQAPPADQPQPLGSGSTVGQITDAPSVTAALEPGGTRSPDGLLVLDIIDYGQDGRLSIAGKGPDDATIVAYLNDSFIGYGPVLSDASWRIDPDRLVAPGIYTMRLDALRDGDIVARIEIPLSRAQPLSDLAGDAFVIVQPGNSLWRIARRTLGSGINFTEIYQANADQIRDPDLIYPGQVFEIPRQ